MQTMVEKSKTGWRAETVIDLPENKILKLHTRHSTNGGVATWASVHHVEGNGMLAHVLTKDFSTALREEPAARCTEKIVRNQHEVVLGFLDVIKQSIQAFYGPKAASSDAEWKSYLLPIKFGAVGA